MKYLFFDIESAQERGHKGNICDFGYILCNSNLEIIEQNDFLINPECSNWDKYVVRHILPYDKMVYKGMSNFTKYSDKIISLLSDPDTMIINHEVLSDVILLKETFNRYNIKQVDYKFYDLGAFYRKYKNLSDTPNLDTMSYETCFMPKRESHTGLDDAYRVYKIIENLCLEFDTDPLGLFSMYDNLSGEIINGDISTSWTIKYDNYKDGKVSVYRGKSKFKFDFSSNNINASANRILYTNYTSLAKKENDVSNILEGKVICFDKTILQNEFTNSLLLIKLIYNNGGSYTRKFSECNCYIRNSEYDELEDMTFKNEVILENHIEVIELDKLKEMLNFNDDEIEEHLKDVVQLFKKSKPKN